MMNTIKQSQWWKYAAGTIPFCCLAILVLLDIIGWTSIHTQFLFIILITFFTAGVLWWWWAVDKIIELTMLLKKTQLNLIEVTVEVIKIKKEVELLDIDLKK
jgi:Zn-dependent protease with chaperone function